MAINISNEQDEYAVDAAALEGLAGSVLAVEGADEEAELSIGIVDEQRMAGLNEKYAGVAGATDVLAFPFDEGVDDIESDPEEPLLLGDVVLCPAVAARNAAEYESTVDAEMSMLLVHGVLHLLGYDHGEADDEKIMRARETELLERFGVGGRR